MVLQGATPTFVSLFRGATGQWVFPSLLPTEKFSSTTDVEFIGSNAFTLGSFQHIGPPPIPMDQGGIIEEELLISSSRVRAFGGRVFADLNLGQDGNLYSRELDLARAKWSIVKIDPYLMLDTRRIDVISADGAVPLVASADSKGNIYTLGVSWVSSVPRLKLYKLSSQGTLLQTYVVSEGDNPLIQDIAVSEFDDVAVLEGVHTARLHIFKASSTGTLTRVVQQLFDNDSIAFGRPENSLSYCDAVAGQGYDFSIGSVSLSPRPAFGGGAVRSRSFNGYEGFQNFLFATFRAGTTPRLTIRSRHSLQETDVRYTIFVDFTRDGDFNDPGEQLPSQSAYGEFNVDLPMPPTFASPGMSRMRIVVHDRYSPTSPSCGFQGSQGTVPVVPRGQVEDYRVLLTNS